MDIGKRIKQVRKEKKISQNDIAKILDITQATYSHLEQRGSKLNFEQLEKIATALGVSVQYLLFGEKESNESQYQQQITQLQQEINELKREIELLRLQREKTEATTEIIALEMPQIIKNVIQRIEQMKNPTPKTFAKVFSEEFQRAFEKYEFSVDRKMIEKTLQRYFKEFENF